MTVKLSQPWLSVSIKCEQELNEQMGLFFPHMDSLLPPFLFIPCICITHLKFGRYFIPEAGGKSVFVFLCVFFNLCYPDSKACFPLYMVLN